jgi:beta-N-acetylhexosaminidase
LNIQKTIKIISATAGILRSFMFYPVAWFWTRHPQDPLGKAVSQILMLGFIGSTRHSLSARLLARQFRNGQIHNIFFVKENIGTHKNLIALKNLFDTQKKYTWVGIDHEGGAVQRLSHRHGVRKLPRAIQVGMSQLNFSQVKVMYSHSAKELRHWGFNLNFGPVLDVHDPKNLAIGKFGRSFGIDARSISLCGAAFVEGFQSEGVTSVLKHFPGHGRSVGDSHLEPANISDQWSEKELAPFKQLIDWRRAPIIMCGHLRLDSIDATGCPATLSKPIIEGLLRDRLGYCGVVMTDDIDMQAITKTHDRRRAMIEALNAGNDLIMIRNLFGYDPLLPKRALYWVRQAIKNGELTESRVFEAAERIMSLKNQA